MLEAFSVSHGKASAYLPVIDLLWIYFEIEPTTTSASGARRSPARSSRSTARSRTRCPTCLGCSVRRERRSARGDGCAVRRRRTLEAIKRILLRESLNQPLIVIFEDLHWVDEETQAFLNLLADAIGTARILMLVNYRPEYSHQWNSKTYYTQLRLDPLGRESAAEMLRLCWVTATNWPR